MGRSVSTLTQGATIWPDCPHCTMPRINGPTLELLIWARDAGRQQMERAMRACGISERTIERVRTAA